MTGRVAQTAEDKPQRVDRAKIQENAEKHFYRSTLNSVPVHHAVHHAVHHNKNHFLAYGGLFKYPVHPVHSFFTHHVRTRAGARSTKMSFSILGKNKY